MTRADLLRCLDYNQENGEFRWREIGNNRVKAGSLAGNLTPFGYIRITISGRRYMAHRLAWLYVTGEWPSHFLDHVNGQRADNRFSNLRLATKQENKRNEKLRVDNTSGYRGVYRHRRCPNRPWVAQIRVRPGRGGQKTLGFFASPEEAHQAYLAAAETHFGAFRRDAT